MLQTMFHRTYTLSDITLGQPLPVPSPLPSSVSPTVKLRSGRFFFLGPHLCFMSLLSLLHKICISSKLQTCSQPIPGLLEEGTVHSDDRRGWPSPQRVTNPELHPIPTLSLPTYTAQHPYSYWKLNLTFGYLCSGPCPTQPP